MSVDRKKFFGTGLVGVGLIVASLQGETVGNDTQYLATGVDSKNKITVEGWGSNVPATNNPPGGEKCVLNTGLPNGKGGFRAIGWVDCDSFDGSRGDSPVQWPGMTKEGGQVANNG